MRLYSLSHWTLDTSHEHQKLLWGPQISVDHNLLYPLTLTFYHFSDKKQQQLIFDRLRQVLRDLNTTKKVIIFTKKIFLVSFYIYFSPFLFLCLNSSLFSLCLLKYFIFGCCKALAPKKLLSPGIGQLVREHRVRKKLSVGLHVYG